MKDSLVFHKELDILEKKNEELKRKVDNLKAEKEAVLLTLAAHHIPIPIGFLHHNITTKIEPGGPVSAFPVCPLPENVLDIPSTSSSIYAVSKLNQRASVDCLQPPPSYQPPRRWTTETPFTMYMEQRSTAPCRPPGILILAWKISRSGQSNIPAASIQLGSQWSIFQVCIRRRRHGLLKTRRFRLMPCLDHHLLRPVNLCYMH